MNFQCANCGCEHEVVRDRDPTTWKYFLLLDPRCRNGGRFERMELKKESLPSQHHPNPED